MKYKIHFLSILITFCALNNCEFCYRDGVDLLEIYCENFAKTMPDDCISLNSSKKVPRNPIRYLKSGGCDFNRVEKLIYNISMASLDFSYSGYTELKLFKSKFTHLTELNVSHNEILEIPEFYFHKTPNIAEIDFSNNKIETIGNYAFEGALQLNKIYLSHNQISIIENDAFVKLNHLKLIDLTGNSIGAFHDKIFRNNRRLQTLLLKGNPLHSFSCEFSSLTKSGAPIYFHCAFRDQPIRIVTNDQDEGLLPTPDGQIELHCNDQSFKKLHELRISRNEIENPVKLLDCLTPSIVEKLYLAGNVIGELESTALLRFVNLQILDLSDTHLKGFNFGILENLNQLHDLDISRNNLNEISNLTFLHSLKRLINLNVGDNQLQNGLEIIQQTNLNMVRMNLAGTYVGKLNATTFQGMKELKYLNLSNTQLSLDDLSPFDSFIHLEKLDISFNNLENVNFITSKIFKNLRVFSASNCKITKIHELLSLFGSSLVYLDLSGNFLSEIQSSTFENLTELAHLNLSNMNLSSFSFEALKHQQNLRILNISNNRLNVLFFVVIRNSAEWLEELYLDENDLFDINGLNHSSFPSLRRLSITKNQLSCKFLDNFVPKLNEWRYLELIEDIWNQKKCAGQTIKVNQAIKDRTNFVPAPAPIPNKSLTPWMYAAIGFSILNVIIVVTVCIIFRKKCFTRTGLSQYDEPRILFERAKETEMPRVFKKLPEIPQRALAPSTSPEENIYEEIPDHGDTYDHLQHNPRPIPIPVNSHYDNFLLLNQGRRN